MTQRFSSRFLVVAPTLVFIFTMLTGCLRPLGGPGGPPPDFYVMTAERARSSPGDTTVRRGPIVGVAPVKLAEHLMHEKIVTRSTGNQVVLADEHRWAAPLDTQFSSLLALNLATMIPTDRVTVLPASPAVSLDYRVEVEARIFERLADGGVELVAVWRVFRGDQQRLLTMRTSTLRRAVSGSGYDAIVNAMSAVLADLSRQIAAEIRG